MSHAFRRLTSLVVEPIWVVTSFVAMSLVVVATIQSVEFFRDGSESTVGQFAVGACIYVLALMFAVLPIFLKRGNVYAQQLLGLKNRPLSKSFWLPFALWPLYMTVTIAVGIAAKIVFPWIDTNQPQEIGFTDISTPLEYVLVFVALTVIPPVVEELLFRGYLFGRLRERFGFVLTSLVVSVVFGIVHGQWNVGIDVFILSLFLCYLREKTGSVWGSIVLHSLKNTVAYLLLFIAPLLGFNLVQ